MLFWIQLGSFVYYGFTNYVESSRNQLIKSQLQEKKDELTAQENQVDHFKNFYQNLALRYGIGPLTSDEFELGVGGPLNKDSLVKRLIHPGLMKEAEFARLLERVDNKVRFSEGYYSDMQAHLERNLNNWRFIPSSKPASGYFSSGFGSRIHPVTGHRLTHAGLDIANAPWTPIMATADGVVEKVDRGPHLGIYVKINHNNGYQTVYGHMKQTAVKVGQFVNRYDLIGYMGSTGRSTGTHVHYEVRLHEKHINPIDYILPGDYIVD